MTTGRARSTGWRPRGSTACWPTPSRSRTCPAGRRRDPADSRWLAACFERGAISSCFVATPEFRLIRLHTRYRRDLTEERTREKQRAEKLLESAAIKLSSVLTDLHGVTGRDIMDHLIAGERNPKVLAQLARARGPPQDRPAGRRLGGRGVLHRRARRPAGGHAGPHRPASPPRSTGSPTVIERLLAPYEEQLQQAETMPGLGAALRPGRRGRDRRRYDPVPAPGRTWPPGPAAPRWISGPPASAPDRAKPKKGNRYLAGSHSARPPSRPAAPRPAKAPATGGWPAAAARPKPRSRWATPS